MRSRSFEDMLSRIISVLLQRAGGETTIAEAELDQDEPGIVCAYRNPETGEHTLRLLGSKAEAHEWVDQLRASGRAS